MPTRPRARSLRIGLLAVVVLAATAASVAFAAGGSSSPDGSSRVSASAWEGLVGGPRPEATAGQRTIVLLRVPSLAERLALTAGRASEARLKRWQTIALAAQEQLIASLAAQGVRVRPDYRYTRVLSGFSAAIDPRGVALLERSNQVRGVYPVRVAYPSTVASDLLERGSAAPGSAFRAEAGLPGFDGHGVTVALLDTGVDLSHRYLGQRVLDGVDVVDGDDSPQAEANPDTGELERHGTQLAGLVAGANGPAGLAGIASGASILPIRVAGWQRDSRGTYSVYARTDQVVAGLEHAVDPNDDGDTHDAARVALLGVAEPFGAFDDSPTAQAVAGALRHDTLVVAPAGNDGPAGVRFGSISGPGGSKAALTVGAADLRARLQDVHVVLRTELRVALDRRLALAGAVGPGSDKELLLAQPQLPKAPRGLEPPPLTIDSFFDSRGFSRVAGRAALVRAGSSPRDAAAAAAHAGADAVVLYGSELPSGGVGLSEDVDVPVVAVPEAVGQELVEALRAGRRATVSIGAAEGRRQCGRARSRALLVPGPGVRRAVEARPDRAWRGSADRGAGAKRRRLRAVRHHQRLERRRRRRRRSGRAARTGAAVAGRGGTEEPARRRRAAAARRGADLAGSGPRRHRGGRRRRGGRGAVHDRLPTGDRRGVARHEGRHAAQPLDPVGSARDPRSTLGPGGRRRLASTADAGPGRPRSCVRHRPPGLRRTLAQARRGGIARLDARGRGVPRSLDRHARGTTGAADRRRADLGEELQALRHGARRRVARRGPRRRRRAPPLAVAGPGALA